MSNAGFPAPMNFFYSHSYIMSGYFDPLLVTGFQAEYKINDRWTAVGGLNEGWQRFEDPEDAVHFLGQPEGELALAQATCYLALAPKSNAVYAAWNAVRRDIEEQPAEPVPLHLRNAPTGLMGNLGYGRGYQYAHDAPDAQVSQEHLPDALRGRVYYRPTDRGAEKDIAARLAQWRAWRDRQKST